MLGAKSTEPRENEPKPLCLSMRTREAAKALGISERTLWDLTSKGKIPYVRLSKAILYPVDSLRDWLKRQAEQNMITNSEK